MGEGWREWWWEQDGWEVNNGLVSDDAVDMSCLLH